MTNNQSKTNWRKDLNILVPEAHAIGSVGVIRSLGCAGYRVHACSRDPKALGLRSNYSTSSVVCPNYADPKFMDWIQAYIRNTKINAIVPSDGFLFAVQPMFKSVSHLMPIPKDEVLAYRPFSKIDVNQFMKKTLSEKDYLRYIPPNFVIERGDDLPSVMDLAEIKGPYYVKSDRAYHCKKLEAFFKRVETPHSALITARHVLENFDAVLIQGWVGGMKAASAFSLHNGRVLARSGVLGLRTAPHQGGMMSMRQSWYHDGLFKETLSWLRAMQWHGVAMVECKWDPTNDRFWLIEINSRFYGYLHLDLYSGVDMPRILMDAHFDRMPKGIPSQKIGVQCRLVAPHDITNLTSKFRDYSVSWPGKIISTFRFILDFFNPIMQADLLYPKDRKLYWLQWLQIFQSKLKSATLILKIISTRLEK